MSELPSRFLDAGGIRTHYIEQGSGQPLVLIHGGGAGADGRSNYSDCLALYAERGYRAIAFDMLGFGGTDKPDPGNFEYTQSARTRHAIAFIEALDLGPVCLIGNSMGGTTSAGVAIERPDLLQSLVLMGAAVNMTAQDIADNRDNLGAVLAYDGSREGMRKIITHLTYDYEPTDAVIDYRYQASIRPDQQATYKATMAWVGKNGLHHSDADLAGLQVPVLVVAGKNDVMVPVEYGLEALRTIPQAFGYVVPNCGHWVMIEYPELFVEATDSFFLQNGSTSA